MNLTKFFERAGAIFTDISYILSPNYFHPNRKKILLDYIRLRLKVSLHRWVKFKKEKILSFDVYFYNYSLFFEEFRQIFIRQSYYFYTEKEEPEIIDCGGNIGVSILYFKYMYPNSKITVFEPSPEVYEIIEKNINKNKLKNITLEKSALSSEEGTSSFFLRGTGSCGSTLKEGVFDTSETDKKHKEKKTVQVKTQRLSKFINNKIDFLKMDIEGSEGEVLEELKKTNTLKDIRKIAFEYHYYKENKNNRLQNILSILEENNFSHEIYLDETTPRKENESYYCLIKTVGSL